MRLVKINLVIVFFEIILSFYFRANFWPLYQKFGFYQGDIWYFFTFYGNQIKNNFFFPIEYPVGYILINKLAFWISLNILGQGSYESFLMANALLIIPILLTLIIIIYRVADIISVNHKSILPFLILSPSLFLYSNINYDIFPTFLVCLALYSILRNKYSLSLFLLALGTTIKLYPIFLVPVFLLIIQSRSKRLMPVFKSLTIFVITFLIINLPFYIYNANYWFYPYLYQAINPEKNDPTTISYYLFNLTGLRNYQSLVMIVLVIISWIIAYLFYKNNLLSPKNIVFLVFLTCLSLVVGNHIYVPQYILWFLPFVALMQIPKIFIWWPFDLLNASTRFFYFKLKSGVILFHYLWPATIIYYLVLYIILLIYVKRILFSEGKQSFREAKGLFKAK